jgi:tetratricopeptide (TPR) repeat protein
MGLFDGLYGYEVVLLVLGAFFFVVLAIMLVLQVVRGKSYGSLLFFFAIPIAMMGYSGIKTIQFKDGTVSIENTTKQLQANPTDTTLRSDLQKQVTDMSSRPTSDPTALTTIAKAQFALGNHKAAETTLRRAMQHSPALPQAQELDQRIKLDQNLTSLTSQVAQNPNDTGAKQKLQEVVTQADQLHIASPVLMSHLAGAQAALGDRKKALSWAETALSIKPNLAEAKQLKIQAAAPVTHQ